MEKIIAAHDMRSVDGRVYTVYEVQELVDASDINGPRWINGMKRLQLEDGSAVNFIDDVNFEVVSTGIRLQRS